MINEFKIIQTCRDYVVINIHGDYENHAHMSSRNAANLIIDIIKKQIVPSQNYIYKMQL